VAFTLNLKGAFMRYKFTVVYAIASFMVFMAVPKDSFADVTCDGYISRIEYNPSGYLIHITATPTANSGSYARKLCNFTDANVSGLLSMAMLAYTLRRRVILTFPTGAAGQGNNDYNFSPTNIIIAAPQESL
jgi:hypothetical protein